MHILYIINYYGGKLIRRIIGIIAGYLAMAVFLFVTFSILYLILGSDGSFKPGSFQISTAWAVFSIILTSLAAIDGGLVCMLIAKHRGSLYLLAAFILVVGIASTVPKFSPTDPYANKVRIGHVSNIEAMQNAIQPVSVLLINPILSAAGIILGGNLIKIKSSNKA